MRGLRPLKINLQMGSLRSPEWWGLRPQLKKGKGNGARFARTKAGGFAPQQIFLWGGFAPPSPPQFMRRLLQKAKKKPL